MVAAREKSGHTLQVRASVAYSRRGSVTHPRYKKARHRGDDDGPRQRGCTPRCQDQILATRPTAHE